MSEHKVTFNWERKDSEFTYKTFSRNHEWDFGHGNKVNATAAPEFLGDPELIDPEQAFVASITSCHGLTFLSLCSLQKIEIESYSDSAIGYLEKAEDGKPWLSKIDLHPEVKLVSHQNLTNEKLEALHEKAHQECFLARSIKTKVQIHSKFIIE